MIWGMGPPTRCGILGGFICAGAIAAVSGFRPVHARAVTLPRAWTGFATAPCWQSFTLVTGDTIVLPVKVASAEVEAIIDSGSAASILSPSLAAKLGVLQAEQRTIRGIGGRANAHLAHDVEILLAGVVSRLPTVIIADLKAISLALGRPVDVVLGEDILAERCVALDFGNGRISVGKSNTFAGGRRWERIPVFHGSNRELLLGASVAGMPTTPMVFDLGNSTALMLSPQYVDDHQLLQGVRKSSAAIGGVDGVRIATAFMSETVELGGFPVRQFRP